MRIRCLRTGVVREKRGTRGIARYLWAEWRDETLPVNAFLIEHPDGPCLFDAGQTVRAAAKGYFPWWHPFFRLARFELNAEDEVVPQLRACGVDPESVRWVVLSHLHTDHVGGLEAFRSAEVLVSRVEWERAQGLAGRVRGYLPQYWPTGMEPTRLEQDRDGFGPFPAAHDVVGDGSLLVVATPGHTPGHVSLLVRRLMGSVLLGGDMAHRRADLQREAPAVARYCDEERCDYTSAHDWDAPTVVASAQTT